MADDKTFTKDEVDAAIEKEVSGLKDKIDELIGDNKKLKADLRKTQDIKPEDVAALESEVDQLKAKLTVAEKTAKEATTAREKAEAALKSEAAFTQKLVVENGLREQLTAAGVTNPAHQKGAIAMLSSQVHIAADGDNRVAKVGDKALADFVKEWAGTDEGKAFVTAPANGGGGAPGSSTKNSNVQTMTRAAYNELDQQAQGEAGLKMAKGELKIVDEAA
jgi:hypothetical protein